MIQELACGQCVDLAIFDHAPFVVPWTCLFLLWSLLLGLPMSIALRKSEFTPPLRPIRWFISFVLISALAAPMAAGSLMLPATAMLLLWFAQLTKLQVQRGHLKKSVPAPELERGKDSEDLWRRFESIQQRIDRYLALHRVILVSLIASVPLSYASGLRKILHGLMNL